MKRKTQLVQTRAVKTKREPSDKQLFKRKAQSFISGIAKAAFGVAYKTTVVKNRPRKAELGFKLKILGMGSSESISRFNQMVAKKARNQYTLTYTGKINPRTNKEELFIDLVMFGAFIKEAKPTEIQSFVKSKRDLELELEGICHEP